MIIAILLEDHMERPEKFGINTIQDYGQISVGFNDKIRSGLHMILESSEEQFKDWLRKYDGIVVGAGSPMLQEFEIMHIK